MRSEASPPLRRVPPLPPAFPIYHRGPLRFVACGAPPRLFGRRWDTNVSKAVPREARSARNGAPEGFSDPSRAARTSKTPQKTKENLCFYDVRGIVLERLRDALLAAGGLRMGPEVAPKGRERLKRSPFAAHFSSLFRSSSALGARFGPERCPSAFQSPGKQKITRKSGPGRQKRPPKARISNGVYRFVKSALKKNKMTFYGKPEDLKTLYVKITATD